MRSSFSSRLGERQAVEELHHDEGPVPLFAEIEDRDDVPVGELAGDPRFAVEALAHVRFLIEIGEHQLDGHAAIQLFVDGGVDHTHRATADSFRDAIPPDRFGESPRRPTFAGRNVHQSAS